MRMNSFTALVRNASLHAPDIYLATIGLLTRPAAHATQVYVALQGSDTNCGKSQSVSCFRSDSSDCILAVRLVMSAAVGTVDKVHGWQRHNGPAGAHHFAHEPTLMRCVGAFPGMCPRCPKLSDSCPSALVTTPRTRLFLFIRTGRISIVINKVARDFDGKCCAPVSQPHLFSVVPPSLMVNHHHLI